jgi:hypothetical protein
MGSTTQEELDQADCGAIGVSLSMGTSPAKERREADSFRPKGGRSYLVG